MSKRSTKKSSTKVASATLAVARGSTFIRWADWDPTYKGNNRLSVYDTKSEQRGCRPDLVPLKVKITVL